jgi:ATP phosphoribosyltransferase regulatory subunit
LSSDFERHRMVKQQQAYPTGVRALLADETSRRRALETAIVGALEQQQFREIVLPILDFVGPYGDILGDAVQRRSYRFTDREGELVSIRSDFTPMIARALAPVIDEASLPLRVFYRGDVIRCEATRLGIDRELFQIGAEVIGDDSFDADRALLELGASLVAQCGIRPAIVYTDVRLARELIEAATPDAELRDEVRRALAHKRASVLARLRDQLEPRAFAILQQLTVGSATLAALRDFAPTAAIAARLTTLDQATQQIAGADFLLGLDDVDEEPGYYTGLRFRIFAPASRATIGQGGRYDALYRRFGHDAAALGFTLTIDYLDAELARNRGAI